MRALRIIAYLFFAGAAVLAGLGVLLLANGRDLTLAGGQLWFDLHSPSLNTFQAVVQRYIHAGLWDNVLVPLLLRPALEGLSFLIVIAIAIGGSFFALSRSRRRRRFKRSSL
jgi:hypothetical protein